MPNKSLQLPRSFIVHVWHFKWRKFKAQYFDNICVSISRFSKIYRGFCAKNIMTLISKTLIWYYSWDKVKQNTYIDRACGIALAAEFRLYLVKITQIHIRTAKLWMEEGNACFEAKFRKHKSFNFNSIKRDVLSALKK